MMIDLRYMVSNDATGEIMAGFRFGADCWRFCENTPELWRITIMHEGKAHHRLEREFNGVVDLVSWHDRITGND